jgi:zinc and cadmium transporter
MNTLLIWILAFSLLGGVLSVVAASLFLVIRETVRERVLPALVSIAIGALLGAAFLGLIPHAIETIGVQDAHKFGAALLGGILVFFILEKLVLWRHCHGDDCEAHGPDIGHARNVAAANLILVGDAVHNTMDGVLIAAAFMTDIHLGVVTALAVTAHEIPQEVGDFALLLNGGYSRARAFLFNALSSVTTLIGAVGAYYFLAFTTTLIPYVLAIAASSFIYIAVADLIPGLHHRTEFRVSVQQLVLILIGIAIIWSTHLLLH